MVRLTSDMACERCSSTGRVPLGTMGSTRTCQTCQGTGRWLTPFGRDFAAILRGIAHDFNQITLE